jgi:hypothetical protein
MVDAIPFARRRGQFLQPHLDGPSTDPIPAAVTGFEEGW